MDAGAGEGAAGGTDDGAADGASCPRESAAPAQPGLEDRPDRGSDASDQRADTKRAGEVCQNLR